MAFVIVQHLAPDHKSDLVPLVQGYTHWPVYEAVHGQTVQPDSVYVIPPNYELTILRGTLQLIALAEPRGHRLPIDCFLTSLADDQRDLSIGIILSGSGSDGSYGIRAIKSAGGMVMVQSPESADYDSMPLSAIQTGMADYVCTVNEMPSKLVAFASRAYGEQMFAAEGRSSESVSSLQKIFVLIRSRTGHDFSHYKPGTIDRRIERRIAVNQVQSLDEYLEMLQRTPREIDALFHELLIGVTSFFRDPDAYEKLDQLVLPQLIADKASTGEPLRIWVSGCSTGEEAYSIAILVQEHLEAAQLTNSLAIPIQIFASDIDARAIAGARAGLYPKSIEESLPPERLARYFRFEPENSAYRIDKKIREMVIFSEHDVNKDPPFSRLDLISCRNLMIYLGGELQHKLIPLFHFSLNPNGVLFLGSSEGIGEFELLFAIIDRKAKLYRRQADFESMPRSSWQRATLASVSQRELPQAKILSTTSSQMPLRALAEQAVLELISPTAALIDDKGDILYLLGRTGGFLEPTAGPPGVSNIFQMAREGLRHPLVTTLFKVATTQQTISLFNVPVKSNGHYTNFDLTISPVKTGQNLCVAQRHHAIYLVLLSESIQSEAQRTVVQPLDVRRKQSPAIGTLAAVPVDDTEALIDSLASQLQAKDETLQLAYEELETSNEELKSSNEELHSVNEELQSTNEELETSKEELQSINEELATVNTELQNKVLDLSRLNNDMNNLLSGSGIATVFVDTKLNILRFTPSVSQIINLINGDIGRPIAHVVSNLVGYDRLVADVQLVLETLDSRDLRVQTAKGAWFQMRIKPYRTLESIIEGVVITFVDVTEIKRAEDSLANCNRQMRLAVVIRDASDAITVQDLEGRIIAWNPSACRLYGWSEEEALQMHIRERVPVPHQRECLAQIARLSQAETLEPFKTQRLTKSGKLVDVHITATALVNESGIVYAIATTERIEASQ